MKSVSEPVSRDAIDSAASRGIEDEEPDWIREFDETAALKKKQEQQRRREERIQARLNHQKGLYGPEKVRGGKKAMFGRTPDDQEVVTAKKKPDQHEADGDDEEFLAESWDSDDEKNVVAKCKRKQASLSKLKTEADKEM